MKRLETPLQSKVMLPVAAILFVCLSGAGYYVIRARAELLHDQLRRRARTTVGALAAVAREGLTTGRHQSMRLLCQKIAREDRDVLSLRIRDRDGTLLIDLRPRPAAPDADPLRLHERVVANDFVLGEVEVSLARKGVADAVNRGSLILFLTLFDIVLLAGFGMHLALKYFVSRPLDRLLAATEAIRRGDYGQKVGLDSRDEVGALGAAFDELAAGLARYRAEVEENRTGLEARVRARTADLEAARARTAAILESLPLAVIVVDGDRVVTETNPAAAALAPQAGGPVDPAPAPAAAADGDAPPAPGPRCGDRVDSPFCRRDCLLERARRGEPHLEETRLGGDGRPVLLGCTPLGDGGLVTVRDIRRLQTMRDQVRRSDRLSSLGTLAAGLAHELNNPLGNISTYSQLLEEAGPDSPRAPKMLRTIRGECERGAAIVNRLLSFSRPAALDPRPLAPGELLGATAELMGPVLAQQDVRLRFDPPPADAPPFPGTAALLQQVLVNLLLNGAQAAGAGGEVTLTWGGVDDAGWTSLRVRDNGPGVPAELMPQLFDPFFTTKAPGEGTGLGLSVCFGILRDHGGTIELRSPPGGGAVAELRLPPAAPPPPADRDGPAAATPGASAADPGSPAP